MSIIELSEIHAQRHSSVDKSFQRTYIRVYRALTDNTADDGYIVETKGVALGLPEIWDLHPNDPTAYVQDIQCDADEVDGKEWLVTVTYQTAVPEQNPLDQSPIVSWSYGTTQFIIFYDVNGKPLWNTAGDPLNPAPLADFPTFHLSVQFNTLLSPSFFNILSNTVNSLPFMGFPLHAVKFLGCAGSQQIYTDDNGQQVIYWSNTLEFEFTTVPTGFDMYLESRGLKQLDNNNKRIKIVKDDLTEATEPEALDENGHYQGEAPYVPYFIKFQYLNEIDFNSSFPFTWGAF